MKARVNTHAIRQTVIESAHFGVLGMVAHPVPDDGEYEGVVLRGRNPVSRFRLSVDEEVREQQADIDLARLVGHRGHGSKGAPPRYTIARNGYIVLFLSEGAGGFFVQLHKLTDDKTRRVFDSRNLQSGDIFVATPLRPGEYAATDKHGKGQLLIQVAYPKPGKTPYVPGPPENVSVTPQGFSTKRLEVGAAQSIAFFVKTEKSAIVVECTKRDQGPREKKGGTRTRIRRAKRRA